MAVVIAVAAEEAAAVSIVTVESSARTGRPEAAARKAAVISLRMVLPYAGFSCIVEHRPHTQDKCFQQPQDKASTKPRTEDFQKGGQIYYVFHALQTPRYAI